MDFLSKKASSLTPYVAGIQPQQSGWVKLNTNENPYPPSPKVAEAICGADFSRLRLYPDGDSAELKAAIAEVLCMEFSREGGRGIVKSERLQSPRSALARNAPPAEDRACIASLNNAPPALAPENIFCANSSDEVLALAFQAFFSGKENVVTPDISYGFYPVWGEMYDVGMKFAPLGADFEVDPADYIGANGVIIANPNAPTCRIFTAFDDLVERSKGVVLIDEAYIEFAAPGSSAVSLVNKHENLLVVRTFSKSHSLAGLRVGYAVGSPALINGLCRVRDAFNSYPLDMLAQVGASAEIRDTAYLASNTAKIIKTREKTINELENLNFRVVPSQANFIFMEAENARELYDYLFERKILVRHWNKPRIANFLRVTIGTDNEMEAFLQCVKQYLNEKQRNRQ
jgi:histidinol-phosphate aminotransferase